jgi:hypothetical protein
LAFTCQEKPGDVITKGGVAADFAAIAARPA